MIRNPKSMTGINLLHRRARCAKAAPSVSVRNFTLRTITEFMSVDREAIVSVRLVPCASDGRRDRMRSREIANSETAMRGEMPGAKQFFELGMMYSTGR